MSFVKENGGPLVIGGVVLAVLTGYMELRMPSVVAGQLEANGIVPKSTIDAMQEDIADVEEGLVTEEAERKAAEEKLDGKIERIVGILLED